MAGLRENLNPYAYAVDSPTVLVDPLGLATPPGSERTFSVRLWNPISVPCFLLCLEERAPQESSLGCDWSCMLAWSTADIEYHKDCHDNWMQTKKCNCTFICWRWRSGGPTLN